MKMDVKTLQNKVYSKDSIKQITDKMLNELDTFYREFNKLIIDQENKILDLLAVNKQKEDLQC
jgi:hypothetical protein